MAATKEPAPATTPGVIRDDETYRKDEFLARSGMKQAAWRTARRNGLKVIETGGRAFVRGADWSAYLDRISRDAVDA